MQGRYGRVGHRSEKSRLLTEVSENMGWRRKHAIRAMNVKIANSDKPWRRRERIYPEKLVRILESVWEDGQYPWSLRLKELVVLWIGWMRRRWKLTREEERQLLAMSAAERQLTTATRSGMRGSTTDATAYLRSHFLMS